MPVLRAQVSCSRCQRNVERSQTLFVGSNGAEKQYECFNCYKNKNNTVREVNHTGDKIDLFCERCNYKFKSRTNICPYCSKTDKVTTGNISIRDLL